MQQERIRSAVSLAIYVNRADRFTQQSEGGSRRPRTAQLIAYAPALRQSAQDPAPDSSANRQKPGPYKKTSSANTRRPRARILCRGRSRPDSQPESTPQNQQK